MRTSPLFSALILTAILVTTGCGGTPARQISDAGNAAPETPTVTVTVPRTVAVTETETETVPPTPTPPPAPTTSRSSSLPTLGSREGYLYRDGVLVSVPFIGTYTPGRYSYGSHKGNVGVKMTVEIKNGSSRILNVTFASLSMSYGARGNQASEIFDSNIGDGFTTKIPPGRIASAVFAFSVPPSDIGNLLLQVSPDFGHDDALFEGSAS